jgi:hypothetical protein
MQISSWFAHKLERLGTPSLSPQNKRSHMILESKSSRGKVGHQQTTKELLFRATPKNYASENISKPMNPESLKLPLLGMLALLPPKLSAAQTPTRLLQDPEFAQGFGAAFIYGSKYGGGRRPPLGKVEEYREILPWQIHLIPDGPIQKTDVRTYPWDFQEGLHHNFVDKRGKRVGELHAHRLVVNHTIEENTAERLQFAQFNNYGLAKDSQQRNQKLVKRVTTNRKGNLKLYYNSKNEIRNAATAHSAKWARDTWPHFLVNQRMLQPISLADYERLDFEVTYRVDEMIKLSNWPNQIRGAARSGMNLKFMFFLRNTKDLEQKLFAGMMLFTSKPKHYAPHLGVEQRGNIFFRASITDDGREPPKRGQPETVQIDVKSLVKQALKAGSTKQPALSSKLEDYAIYNFSIGFEGMGHWESVAEISNLSFHGVKE